MKNRMIHINLTASKWIIKNNIAVCGYCFDAEGNIYVKEQLLELFRNTENENDFVRQAQKINGIFSVVVHNNDSVFAFSDKSRVNPLFYSLENECLTITDNPYLLLNNTSEIDNEAEKEFLLSSFILDGKTLVKDIFQIKPSCILCYQNGKVIQKKTYSYCVENNEVTQSENLSDEFSVVLENVFKRLLQSVNERQIVVPLSGGYDSRLILAMLKKHSYKNVICYTVGRTNNCEFQIAKQVAQKLDYSYFFINTNNETLLKDYTETETFQQYYKFSGAFSNSFWMYEYFGVKYLVENNLIEKNAVFVPGHSGDFLAGSQTTKMNIFATDNKVQFIRKLAKYLFTFGKWEKKHTKKLSDIVDFQNNFSVFSLFDDFILKHRLPYVPNNSTRLYEFFNHEVRLPFWDNEILDFFRTLPPTLKYDKFFYKNFLKNRIFDELGINFTKELQQTHKINPLQPLKDFIKPFTPKLLFKLVSKYEDITCMKEVAKPLIEELIKHKIKLNTIQYNEVFAKWYLMKVKETLTNTTKK